MTRRDQIEQAAKSYARRFTNDDERATRVVAFEAGAQWADTKGHPTELDAGTQQPVCHWTNPCPDRPRYFLKRFRVNPWRCPQCSRWWVVERRTSYAAQEGFWVWIRAEGRFAEDD